MDASSRVSPLRQRMIDDMRMRKLSEKTQSHYLRWVQRFAAFLGRSPDSATVENLRRYQLHLVDQGTSPVSLNAAITGLKFFFEVTLDQGELMAKMEPVRVPRTLPVVLSREEAARLLAAARNLKHQTALSVAYGAIATTCAPSSPHSRLASPNDSGASRGFLPRGLCDACPRCSVTHSHAGTSGQASHNPKQMQTLRGTESTTRHGSGGPR